MAYRKDSINFYAEVETSVRKAFQKQWKQRKQSNNDATTAALRLWVSLPIEIQVLLISCPDFDVKPISDFLGSRLREALSKALAPEGQSEKTPVDSGLKSR